MYSKSNFHRTFSGNVKQFSTTKYSGLFRLKQFKFSLFKPLLSRFWRWYQPFTRDIVNHMLLKNRWWVFCLSLRPSSGGTSSDGLAAAHVQAAYHLFPRGFNHSKTHFTKMLFPFRRIHSHGGERRKSQNVLISELSTQKFARNPHSLRGNLFFVPYVLFSFSWHCRHHPRQCFYLNFEFISIHPFIHSSSS